MKKNLFRIATALFFLTLFCICITVSAENTKGSKYSVAMAVELQKFLTAQSTTVSKECDINFDGKINAVDLTLLKRYLIYGEPGTSTTYTETTTSTTTSTSKTTTTATSTTSITSTTQTTTTSSSSTPAMTTKVGYTLIKQAIEEVSVKDTTIPEYKGDYYEATDAVFLFKVGDKTYAYTLLSEKPMESLFMMTNINLVKGAHIWLYEGSASAVSVDDKLPNTEGLTFTADDPSAPNQQFPYELKEYSKLLSSDITTVAKKIASNGTQYGFNISNYDYNLSGRLEYEDVKIMVNYFSSELHNLFWRLNETAFWRYVYNLPTLGHTNVVLLKTDSTKPVDYAFNIPTADLVQDSTNQSVFVPVQILPASMINELGNYTEQTEISDGTCDYIAWNSTNNTWAKVSNDSENWRFQSGIYVFLLDESGNYRKEWVH